MSILGLLTSHGLSQTFQDTLEYPWQYIGNDYYLPDTIIDPPSYYTSITEQLTETIWIPGLPGGNIPYDLKYVGDDIDKLFVYGDRKIIVIDGSSNEAIHEIYLSDYGNESLPMYQSFFSTKENHLAWNPDINMIYCVDAGLNLYLINPQTYDLVTLPYQITGLSYFDYTILKYNDLTNQLFWLIGKYGSSFSRLIVFSTDDQTIEMQHEWWFNQPLDLEFHPIDPVFYISDDNFLHVYDCNTFQEENYYDLDMEAGEIILAYSSTFNTDKVYCLPHVSSQNPPGSPNILVLNGTTSNLIPVNHWYYTAGYYNTNNNMVFTGYSYKNPDPAGVSIYLADNQNTMLVDHEFQGYPLFDNVADFTCFGNKTIGCSKSRVFFFNNSFFLTDYIFDENVNAYYFRICSDESSKIFATNNQGGKIDVFSAIDYSFISSTQIGCASYHGFIDQGTKRLYTYNSHDKGNHELISYDLVSKEINVFDIGYRPSGMAHDYLNHKIYISNYYSSSMNQELSIQVFDCSDNILTGQNIVIEDYVNCNEIFWAPDNTLYISAEPGWGNPIPVILIYDLNTGSIVKSIITYGTNESTGHDTHFLYEPKLNKVFISIKQWDPPSQPLHNGAIICVTNDPDQNYPYSRTLNIPDVDKMKIDLQNNTLIIRQYNLRPIAVYDELYLYSILDGSYISVPVKQGTSICDIEFDPYRDNIYCTFDDISGDLYKLDGASGGLLQIIRSKSIINSLLFNPLNGNIYIHAILRLYPDEEEGKKELLSYDPDQGVFSSIYLGQKESQRNHYYAYTTDIILDEEENNLYLTNAHSNIKVVSCSFDQLNLANTTWNWLSFPVLDRSAGDPTPEQILSPDDFDPDYNELEMKHLYVDNSQENMTSVTWNTANGWVYNGLEYIFSEKGYKLRLGPEQERTLFLSGSVLDPLTPLHLYPEKRNWAGYFIPFPQNPFDAIPENITDNLYSMVSQYWSCYNYALIQPPPPTKSTANTTAQWRCACNQLKMELNYGDMVILHSKEEQYFAWNQTGSDPDLPNKDAPENFVFEEKADYNAYFIKLDTNDFPVEIGAFAGDSCIGATKVLTGDTTVLICGYDEGFEGEEISFQTVYNTKSTKPVFDDYMLLNTQTGIMENRRIVAGETQPFYLISLKSGAENETVSSSAWIRCLPNPARQQVSLSYFIPGYGDVKITIAGLLGEKWYSEKRGYQAPGEYKFDLESNQLPSGCYLVTLHFNQQTITNKLLIFK